MLELKDCRQLLALEPHSLSDSELDELRHCLYELAAVAVKSYSAIAVMPPNHGLGMLPPSEREEAEERAGILEYDGGLSRSSAEQLAVAEILQRRKKAMRGVA